MWVCVCGMWSRVEMGAMMKVERQGESMEVCMSLSGCRQVLLSHLEKAVVDDGDRYWPGKNIFRLMQRTNIC